MLYEVSIYSEDLVLHGPSPRILAFHATLILDASDRDAAEAQAISTLQSDPQLTALAADPPTLAIDAVTELPPDATPHGPILCFFQLPVEGRSTPA